jgi:hypothetical protein
MNEQEWLTCTDPQLMLDFMFERTSRRKIELYTSGSYRLVWHLLPDERFRNKMDVRERYFDGVATEEEFCAAIKAGDEVPHHLFMKAWDSIPSQSQVLLLHDLFGNPFRPITLDPSWLTCTVVSLAQVVYDERKFDQLPILADALEEAGCNNAEILNHCRGPGPHSRGCWAVDAILGKG